MATALQVKNQYIFDLNTGFRLVVSQFTQAADTSNTLTIPLGAISGVVFAPAGVTAATGTVTFSGTTATIGSSTSGTAGVDQFLVTFHAGAVAAIR